MFNFRVFAFSCFHMFNPGVFAFSCFRVFAFCRRHPRGRDTDFVCTAKIQKSPFNFLGLETSTQKKNLCFVKNQSRALLKYQGLTPELLCALNPQSWLQSYFVEGAFQRSGACFFHAYNSHGSCKSAFKGRLLPTRCFRPAQHWHFNNSSSQGPWPKKLPLARLQQISTSRPSLNTSARQKNTAILEPTKGSAGNVGPNLVPRNDAIPTGPKEMVDSKPFILPFWCKYYKKNTATYNDTTFFPSLTKFTKDATVANIFVIKTVKTPYHSQSKGLMMKLRQRVKQRRTCFTQCLSQICKGAHCKMNISTWKTT